MVSGMHLRTEPISCVPGCMIFKWLMMEIYFPGFWTET